MLNGITLSRTTVHLNGKAHSNPKIKVIVSGYEIRRQVTSLSFHTSPSASQHPALLRLRHQYLKFTHLLLKVMNTEAYRI